MGRTTGTASLADLIRRGLLEVGDRLVLRQRNKPDTIGTLVEDGSIVVGDQTYTSPSAAARGVTRAKAAQGWTRWRVARLNSATLDEVRSQLDD